MKNKDVEFKQVSSELLAEAKRVYSKMMGLTPKEIEDLSSESVLLTALDCFIRGCEKQMKENELSNYTGVYVSIGRQRAFYRISRRDFTAKNSGAMALLSPFRKRRVGVIG